MQTHFDVVLKSIHTVQVNLPQIGDTVIPANGEVQLLNASVNIINNLRSTFAGSGVMVSIGKKSANPVLVHDYMASQTPKTQEQVIPVEPKHETPLEKVSNYELPSGKHKGKKLRDLDDDTLKIIARTTKTQVVKSAIEAYLNLK